jgi:hypothetical protein
MNTLNPIKVVFCIPGREFNIHFMKAWTQLVTECMKIGIQFIYNFEYNPVVNYARTRCLGADIRRGIHQKPFNGALDYDYIMWIDSDMLFKPEDFFNLLESPHDITCGHYMTEDRVHIPAVEKYDNSLLLKNGHYDFFTIDTINKYIKKNQRYVPVEYAGMGWMLIKKGVFEKVNYPWFFRGTEEFAPGIVDMVSEDVAFCKNVKDAGFKIMLDTKIHVGHIKTVII